MSSVEFEYILEKIKNAKFISKPFPHLDIKNFLSEKHLEMVLNEPYIHFSKVPDISELYNTLKKYGWVIQNFPGCIDDWDVYLKKLENSDSLNTGITFRLKSYENEQVKKLLDFMNGKKFHDVLRKKFNLKKDTTIISAIQKNLSGYNITPHPDTRRKALTYLLNINRENFNEPTCHTHILKFKEKYAKIQDTWENTSETHDRCWVPWDWCETVKMTSENNSMLIFHPDNKPATLHAIRLIYDHLKYQRTQIYGNLMYKDPPAYNVQKHTELM